MTELRRDPFTGRWVIIAPERDRRPFRTHRQPEPTVTTGPCPFCPGHEAETPQEVWRLDDEDGDWQVRVVPNKYPVLNRSGRCVLDEEMKGLVSVPGTGRHEVVIESPRHQDDLSMMSVDAVRNVLSTYRARYQAMIAEGWAHAVIFRNRGPGAGASLEHPHSQIVATPMVPPEVRLRSDIATEHLNTTGRSLHCDILEWELLDSQRVLLEREQFVVVAPFASSVPYETWIMPRRERSAFDGLGDDELTAFATVLRATLGGLDQVLGNFDYNFVIENGSSGLDEDFQLSWCFRLLPRLTAPAGFELASGINVNPVLPEVAAATLRPVVTESLGQL